MDKQILKAVEEAYRKGLREGNAIKDITPYWVTSQVVAHEIANKFCKAHIIKSVCEHKHKTKIGFGISDSICDNCGERIKQTVL